jgi:2-polyprenyl-6-methoxyphenol hydroxylase-like FAD-dependent oxidoreductase
MAAQQQATVLVAGAGPIGTPLSLQPAAHGVRSILVERNPHTTRYPKTGLTAMVGIGRYTMIWPTPADRHTPQKRREA